MTARDLAESPDVPAPAPSAPSTSRSPSSKGQKAFTALSGRYRSLFVIGRGGMGSVEAALEIEPASEPGAKARSSERTRARGYERIVALKRLLPDSAHDKRRVDMFLREARLAAMLDHPNVVSAYDYGELDGELYLALEYVEGQPLSRVLKALAKAGERLPAPVAAWILAEVCRGLHAAHELADPRTGLPLQLVHRDVSPHNVMIGYDGRVRLLDFGVAKIESESATKTGEVKGKTAYMSPEQAMGDRLDRRSDLFSVGSVLFECLALRRMWGDGTDMEVIRKLALESPPSLDAVKLELPKGLAELHTRLVAREAKNRPATAIEVAGDLLAFVDDPEGAAEKLRTILDAHFTEEAREQQAQLNAALREVAPEQADELRESMLPSLGRMSTRLRAGRTSDPSPVPATPVAAKPVTSAPVKNKRTGQMVFGALGVAIVALIAWRQLAGAVSSPETKPDPIVMLPVVVPQTFASVAPSVGLAPSANAASAVSVAPAVSVQRSTVAPPPTVAPSAPPATVTPPLTAPRASVAPRTTPSTNTSTNTSVPHGNPPPSTSTSTSTSVPHGNPPPSTSTSTSTSTSVPHGNPPPTSSKPPDLDEKPF